MRHTFHIPAAIAAAALAAILSAAPAAATCTRLAFSVNDYGKDGPSKDAKQLLDKYVAKWAKDHSIAKYVTGKKDVSCELFLNFVLFDEHTCKASASVCWEGPAVPGMPGMKPETASTTTTDAPAKPKSVAKSSSKATGTTTTGSIEKPAEKPAAEKTEAAVKTDAATEAKPAAEAKKAVVEKPASADKKEPSATGATSADAPKKPVVRSSLRLKPKTLSAVDAAKAAEAAKPKAPLPQKPESAPVQ